MAVCKLLKHDTVAPVGLIKPHPDSEWIGPSWLYCSLADTHFPHNLEKLFNTLILQKTALFQNDLNIIIKTKAGASATTLMSRRKENTIFIVSLFLFIPNCVSCPFWSYCCFLKILMFVSFENRTKKNV